jgi:hypothetical protein
MVKPVKGVSHVAIFSHHHVFQAWKVVKELLLRPEKSLLNTWSIVERRPTVARIRPAPFDSDEHIRGSPHSSVD